VPHAVDSPSTTHVLEWVALLLTPGLGPTKARKLVEHFGSPENVFSAALTALEETGIQAVSAQSIVIGKSTELAREELARASAAGVSLVSVEDPSYPPRLKEIYDPPLILYVRGPTELLTKPGLAVVGTRHPTPYGSGMAERLACDLAAQGLVIISGMARGVDTAGHRGAISAKGKTVAVFGTGLDVIYPKENSRLSEQILAFGGALISEFPLGTLAGCPWACWWWRPRNILARASRRAWHWSRTATFLPCPAMSPIRMPGVLTRSSSRAPSWLRPGKTFGKNSRQKYDLP
jgi:predicted Rossmann fold nucleotide-binding protein DprA/Smf involved in DNA uptake